MNDKKEKIDGNGDTESGAADKECCDSSSETDAANKEREDRFRLLWRIERETRKTELRCFIEEQSSTNPWLKSGEPHIDLASLLIEDNEFDEAKKILTKAIELKVDIIGDVYIKFGELYLAQLNFDKAEHYFRLALDCKNELADFSLGALYFLKEDFNQARHHLNIAVKKRIPMADLYLGGISYKEKDFDSAEKHFKAAFEAGLEKEATFWFGWMHYEKGDLIAAEQYFKDLLEKYMDKRAYYGLGSVYYKKGDIQGAKKYLEKASGIGTKEAGNLLIAIELRESNFILGKDIPKA